MKTETKTAMDDFLIERAENRRLKTRNRAQMIAIHALELANDDLRKELRTKRWKEKSDDKDDRTTKV